MFKRCACFVFLALAGVLATIRGLHERAGWRARGVHVARTASIVRHAPDAIDLAPGVAVGHGALLVATTERSALPPQASRLIVGARTSINEYCNLRACGGEIRIGRECLVAQMVTIVASNHATAPGVPMMDQDWSLEPRSVSIGDDVWIGAGATVLPGACIESGAVIAAGAVVRGRVPAGESWGGVPARLIGRRGAAGGGDTP